ncbi:MAG: ABC transporter permease [Bacteroidota bacterium]
MSMILAVMYREFKIRTTSMTWLFYDLLVPLAYLLLFGLSFNAALGGGFIHGPERISYNAFFLPGVLAMSSFGIAINTAYGFFVDRDNGIFYEFLTYPMTRGQFLIGKICFNALMALIQAAITVLAGATLLEITILWERIGLLALAVVAGTAGWFFFLTFFALRIRRNDMFNTFLNAAYFILMFVSSIFYPVDSMPGWLRTVSYFNPLTWHTDVLRFATIGGESTQPFLEAAGFLLFLLAAFWVSVYALRYRVVE